MLILKNYILAGPQGVRLVQKTHQGFLERPVAGKPRSRSTSGKKERVRGRETPYVDVTMSTIVEDGSIIQRDGVSLPHPSSNIFMMFFYFTNCYNNNHMKTIKLKITPRSSKNEIGETMSDGTLKIKLKAPPVDGEANKELIKFLSAEWKIPKSKIKIIKGLTSRTKIIEIED